MAIALQFFNAWLIGELEQAMPLAAAGIHLSGLHQVLEAWDVVPRSRHGQPVALLLSEQADQALKPPPSTMCLATAARHGDVGCLENQAWCDPYAGRELPLG